MCIRDRIRFEYSEDGGFEDRATRMVCDRDFPVQEFWVSDGGEELHIYTKDLEIRYDKQKMCIRDSDHALHTCQSHPCVGIDIVADQKHLHLITVPGS